VTARTGSFTAMLGRLAARSPVVSAIIVLNLVPPECSENSVEGDCGGPVPLRRFPFRPFLPIRIPLTRLQDSRAHGMGLKDGDVKVTATTSNRAAHDPECWGVLECPATTNR